MHANVATFKSTWGKLCRPFTLCSSDQVTLPSVNIQRCICLLYNFDQELGAFSPRLVRLFEALVLVQGFPHDFQSIGVPNHESCASCRHEGRPARTIRCTPVVYEPSPRAQHEPGSKVSGSLLRGKVLLASYQTSLCRHWEKQQQLCSTVSVARIAPCGMHSQVMGTYQRR